MCRVRLTLSWRGFIFLTSLYLHMGSTDGRETQIQTLKLCANTTGTVNSFVSGAEDPSLDLHPSPLTGSHKAIGRITAKLYVCFTGTLGL